MSNKIIHSLLLALWVLVAPGAQAAVVNINKADAAAMVENLEGIGPKKAAAIVSYRKKNGAFKSIDGLMEVKGIGEKIVKKNRRDLSLNKGAVKATGKPKAATAKKSAKKTKATAAKPAKKSSKPTKSTKKTTKKKKPTKKTSSSKKADTKKE